MASDLPCNDGCCMKCQASPDETELILCRTCATPWHVACLTSPPETLASVAEWECPDCSGAAVGGGAGGGAATAGATADLVAAIREIEADPLLTEQEKAKRRQVLLSGSAAEADESDEDEDAEKGKEEDVIDMMDHLKCSFCMQLPERPITTTCGHNFCLKCFLKWTGQGKRNCAKCRAHIPSHMASHPRINSQLVETIRIAKQAKTTKSDGSVHVYHYMHNQDRPDKAFTTVRAKRAGKSNAASGQIFVTVPQDHFGPIPAENDPRRNQGVLVGESWEDRLECRQWGAHFVHVAGIAGQSEVGAQSVALSGGYEDDEDHGEWFLYTGSGGRDLGGNKRTNKHQSFDQTFTKSNEALRVSCKKGYPVRVVRSHKEKRSSYAPEKGVRYDGIYRIEKCWRKVGIQGHKVCRYLFVRCDNDPAPWTSDGHGDLPRSLPVIKELKGATDITERKESPSWDHDEKLGWKWMKPPPPSKKPVSNVIQGEVMDKRVVVRAQKKVLHEKMLKGFCCMICQEVMVDPLTTPCAHHFCKACLLDSYADKSFVVERTREGGRSLRARKITKKCPKCPTEISDFLQNPQINTGVMVLIEDLKKKVAEDAAGEDSDADEKPSAEESTTTPSPPDSPSGNNAMKKSPKEVKKSDDVDVEEKSSAEKRTNVPRKSLSGSKRKVAATKKKSVKKVRKSDRVVDADHENINVEESLSIKDAPSSSSDEEDSQ